MLFVESWFVCGWSWLVHVGLPKSRFVPFYNCSLFVRVVVSCARVHLTCFYTWIWSIWGVLSVYVRQDVCE